jgi:hypothetical protein
VIPWPDALPLVERILAALELRADGVALGERFLPSAPAERTAALERLLYEECFIKELGEREPARVPVPDPTAFVAGLRAANAGRGRRSGGWRLVGADAGGRAVVAKDGRRWSVAPELIAPGDGDSVTLRLPNEALDADYYHAYGDALPVGSAPAERTRYYVNLENAGAARLVASITGELNRAGLPFALKCFRDPHDYYRRDGAVVYVERRHDGPASALLRACAAELAELVRDPTPLLTRRLGPGLAGAPDPGGQSYGRFCCALLARALLAEPPGASDARQVVAAAARLERRGAS